MGRWVNAAVGCLAAAGVVTGCGSTSLGRAGDPASPDTGSRAILAAWSNFPASARQRPLVLIGPTVLGPNSGFATDADKEAFTSGHVVLGPGVAGLVGGMPNNAFISADQALTVMGGEARTAPSGGPLLVVTSATLRSAVFATDRGDQSLPAWRFRLRGVRDDVSVLALPSADWWPQPGMTADQVVAVQPRDAASRTVTVWFVGGPSGTGPCSIEYTGTAAESATAVVVTPVPRPKPAGSSVICTLEGHRRSVTVTLASPLGSRVLLTPHPWLR